jgi:hypothetical protein
MYDIQREELKAIITVGKFFTARFRREPHEDIAYFMEWVGRYLKGPDYYLGHSDLQSLEVWVNMGDEKAKEYLDRLYR